MESPCVEADLGTVVVVEVGTGFESWTALCARLDLSCTKQKQGISLPPHLCVASCFFVKCNVADPDPESGAFLTPGFGIRDPE